MGEYEQRGKYEETAIFMNFCPFISHFICVQKLWKDIKHKYEVEEGNE